MSHAFVAPLCRSTWTSLTSPPCRCDKSSLAKSPSPPRRRRCVTHCAIKNLLVVDLQELLRHPGSQSDDLKSFSERVQVDRSTSKDTTYVLYSSASGYDATSQSIQDADLIQPDAITTLNGTELYQKSYRTPDPYWTQLICSGWTSKPVEWVFANSFKDEVERVASTEEFVVNVWCKEAPSADFCERADTKLKEMGISARVVLGDQSKLVMVLPAAATASKVVEFCQQMLNVEENNTFVFGSDELVKDCVQGKGTVGLCGAGSEHDWDAFDGRVFVSSKVGAKALLDGVMHHAIF